MKTYQVTITEKLELTIPIEASSRHEAERLAERQWVEGVQVLSADHFSDVTFTAVTPKKERSMER